MNKANLVKIALLIIISIVSFEVVEAQSKTTITGIVTDAETGETLPLSNIYFKGTVIGSYSEMDGTFKLETIEDVDTLVIKQIGYKDYEYAVNKGQVNEIEAEMLADELVLAEIVVIPGENPAHPIIRNIIKNKDKNNPENFPTYSCETYSRLNAGISNMRNEEDRKSLFSKIGRNLPTVVDSLGNKYMPLFVTEQLAEIMYDKESKTNNANVISNETNGISVSKDLEIGGYTEALNSVTNFYNNKLTLLDKNFISPIATSGFMHYKYYLEDSVNINGNWEYRIRFKPKRKKDFAFIGELKVMEGSWALTAIEVTMPKNTNINYLNDFEVDYEFQPIDDSIFFFKKNRVYANFDYKKSEGKKKPMISFEKTTFYNKVEVDKPKVVDSLKIKDADIPRETVALVLEKYRNETLAGNTDMDLVIDSINNIWWVKQLDKLTSMFLSGYYNVGKVEIGPYLDMIKKNKVEGNRFILTGRTAESFSKNVSISAMVGYGTRDKKYKYGGEINYKFNTRQRQVLGLGYSHNVSTIGRNQNIKLIKENMLASGEDNWIAHLINRKENDKMAMKDQAFLYSENELRKGLNTKIGFNYSRFFEGEFVPFVHNDSQVSYFDDVAATVGIRFSFKEKTADRYFRRYYLGSKYPVINILATAGRHTVDSAEGNYLKLHLCLKHKFNIGVGQFQYVVEAGKIFGDVPFPLLENQRGNETYGYSRYRFNLLDNLAFASDQYVSIMTEFHMNGMIFNRLPLIRRLNFREVLSAKAMYGSLRNEHANILNFPEQYGGFKDPYVEVGAGIENIFKLFRVEAVWRVSPLEIENALDFGVRMGMKINF